MVSVLILDLLIAAIGMSLGAVRSMKHRGWPFKLLGTGLALLALIALGLIVVAAMAM
jgi:hypothetical protein